MSRIICHCFGYTETDIVNDVRTHGRSVILEKIVQAGRNGACRCSVLNPSGR